MPPPKKKDGSLNIYISPEFNPEWPKTNWQLAPKEHAFNLTMRMYVPKDNVINGDWFPLDVEFIEANKIGNLLEPHLLELSKQSHYR